MATTLGLDLGTNSIGWVLIENNGKAKGRVIDSGVRIFQEAVEAKTRTPKNMARREARSARRRLARRNRRKQVLREVFQEFGLLPESPSELDAMMKLDPYELRLKALDSKLEPHELGRAIYHLNQRRGFLSNRKADRKDADTGVVKEGITELSRKMESANARTLGSFLSGLEKKRGWYTHRDMLKDEFEAIITAQRQFHPKLLTAAAESRLHRIIFFQRPLKIQKHLIGYCQFEPHRHRGHIASLTFQKFRILQSVNNLEVRDPKTFEWRRLTEKKRSLLIKQLDKTKTMKWDSIRKKLELHEGEVFNLEQGRHSGLRGNETACDLRRVLKESSKPWDDFAFDDQQQLVTDLLTIDKEEGLLRRLQEHWGFSEETSIALSKVDLPGGVGGLSNKAMRKILPHLEKGLIYNEACTAAGYDHTKPRGRSHQVLPLLDAPPALRNPVVTKSLWETRKVVNNLIRVYGKPDVIRIEMAREMKQTRTQRVEYQKRQKQQEHKRDLAREVLQRDFNIQQPSRTDIEKYNLWLECDQMCPYTGTPISASMLFSEEVDIEHILPLSRTLDNSYMNKSLCIARENRQVKRNQTPWEAYGSDEKRIEEIAQRVKGFSSMPWPKKQRFTKKELDTDKFIERQLNDTRYISREVKDYLKRTGADVQVTTGNLTWWLRGTWGLNRILSPDGDGEKNRADHRHHAVDAAVIAVTTLGLYQKLSRLAQENPTEKGLRDLQHYVPSPWPGFEEEVRASILGITVSHASLHKLSGALHEETAYGVADRGENGGKMKLTYRVRLDGISASQVKRIRDDRIRELVESRIAENGGDLKKAFAEPLHMTTKSGEQGPRIETVRLLNEVSPSSVFVLKDEEGHPLKAFQYGNNHHVEIIENIETGKRKILPVTMMEAAHRARIERKPMVQKDHGPEWKFVTALHINDMVETLDQETGETHLYRVQILPGADPRITLRDHRASTLDNDSEKLRANLATMEIQKLNIDPIGRVREARD